MLIDLSAETHEKLIKVRPHTLHHDGHAWLNHLGAIAPA
jgi:hypothetical protein